MKQNLILKTALAVALGSVATSAFAGVASPLPKTFATPLFSAASATAPAIAIAPVSYATAVPLSPNTTYYVYVKVQNSATFSAGITAGALQITDAAGTPRFTGGAAAAAPNGINVAAPTYSTDGTYLIFPVSIPAGSNPLQINSTITFTAPYVAATNTGVVGVGALATVGNTISASMSIGGTSNIASVQSDVDTLSTGVVAKSALPVTATLISSSSSTFIKAPLATTGNYLGQIDAANAQAKLVTNPTNNVTASTQVVDFGAIELNANTNVFGLDGVTPYVFSNTYAGAAVAAAANAYVGAPANAAAGSANSGGLKPNTLSFTVAGNFGAFAKSTNTLWLDTTPACAAPTAALTGSVNAAATSATFGVASAISDVAGTYINAGGVVGAVTYLCGQVDTKTVITPTEPSIAAVSFTDLTSNSPFTITPSLVNGPVNETTGLYNLAFNGGVAVTPIYVSKAGNGLGSMFVRVINVGYNAAPVTLSVINDASGKTGTQSGLVTSSTIPLQSAAGGLTIPPQGAIVLSTSDIENIIGAIPATSMPRLMFTAPTNLAVQTYVLTSQGAFSELDPVTGLTR